MIKNFTQFGQCILACLFLSLICTKGFSKSLQYNQHIITASAAINIDPSQTSILFETKVLNNNTVSLNWRKTPVNSTSYFEIERSFDQQEFQTVALLMTDEEGSQSTESFKFKDNSKELAGKKQAWYRIKEVTTAGVVSISRINTVNFVSSATAIPAELTLFPNPFLEKLAVKFISKAEGNAEVRLLNFNGGLITAKKSILTKGSNSIELIDLASLTNGVYIVEISMNGTTTERQKVIKK